MLLLVQYIHIEIIAAPVSLLFKKKLNKKRLFYYDKTSEICGNPTISTFFFTEFLFIFADMRINLVVLKYVVSESQKSSFLFH